MNTDINDVFCISCASINCHLCIISHSASQTPSSAFGSTHLGQSSFGRQRGGSRVINFAPTFDEGEKSTFGEAAKLESISAMQIYKDKSHEELRWEDYQIEDKCIAILICH